MICNERCEGCMNPVGMDSRTPVFSWSYECSEKSFSQASYRIRVRGNGMTAWDSGEVKERTSINIPYEGTSLESMTKYTWDIKVVTEEADVFESKGNLFHTGIMDENHEFNWICYPGENDNPVFYGDFYVKDQLHYCLVAISGLGYYELKINGQKAHDSLNVPGWTDYSKRDLSNLLYPYDDKSLKRVLYNVHEPTGQLANGLNRFEVMLGNGFFNQLERNIEGDLSYGKPRLFMEIHMIYKSGTREVFAADESTFCTEGPLEFNNIYYGEIRNDNIGMSFDGNLNSERIEWEHGAMECQFDSFDVLCDSLVPVLMKNGTYDCGMNVSGRARITAKGPRGSSFSLRYFEAFDEQDKPDYNPSGGEWQIQENKYIFGENETVIYAETFGWRAFRYFILESDIDVIIEDLMVDVIYGAKSGENDFKCSNDTIEWIYDAYRKSQLSNMHGGVPSDCPHRERLGYTGDGHVTCESALLTIECIDFYNKWLRDILLSQNRETGFVPHTVPFYGGGGGPAWGSACAIVPWTLYNFTFDERIVSISYPIVLKWIEYLEKRNPELIITMEEEGSWCLGDWCLPVGGYEVTETDLDKIFRAMDPAIVNTCFFYRCITICIEMGKILGRSTVYHERLARRVSDKFNQVYFDREKNLYGTGEYCTNVYPLYFDMVPGDCRNEVATNLNEYAIENGYLMKTGIFAASMIFRVLSEFGFSETTERMLVTEDWPSYGYMKENGATTLWETWDGNASGNHPMFGGSVSYLIRYMAGIRFFNRDGLILFEPVITGRIDHASAGIMTVFGKVSIGWKRNKVKGTVTVEMEIPGNTKGALRLFGESRLMDGCRNSFELDEPVKEGR